MDIRILAITLEQLAVLLDAALRTEALAEFGSISFTRLFFNGFTTTVIDTPLEAGAVCIGIAVAIDGVMKILQNADNVIQFKPRNLGQSDPSAESDIA